MQTGSSGKLNFHGVWCSRVDLHDISASQGVLGFDCTVVIMIRICETTRLTHSSDNGMGPQDRNCNSSHQPMIWTVYFAYVPVYWSKWTTGPDNSTVLRTKEIRPAVLEVCALAHGKMPVMLHNYKMLFHRTETRKSVDRFWRYILAH